MMNKALLLISLFSLSALSLKGQNEDFRLFQCPDSSNNFRALSTLNDTTIWLASDQSQVWFFSLPNQWENRSPKGYEGVLWRDIEAMDDSSAIILSAGAPALILRTEDAGQTWQECFRDDSPSIFFDAFDFWDTNRGLAFADAQESHITIIETMDGGKSWQKWDSILDLKVSPKQGGFAASGTCLHCYDQNSWAIVLGGIQARILGMHKGQSLKALLAMNDGEASKGAFSIDAKNADTLLIGGGDYRADSLSTQSLLWSTDAGKSWEPVPFPKPLSQRYWSCVQWQGSHIVLCSRFGMAYSFDNGMNWQYSAEGFYSCQGQWLSGPKGLIARFNSAYK